VAIRKNLLIGALVAGMGFASTIYAENEVAGVMQLKEINPDRVYLQDMVIAHMADSRMYIIDGKTMKMEGMISTGMNGNTVSSPDQKTLYAAATYYTKLNRGDRTDQIEIYDIKTLTRRAEIVIPPKHAQSLPYPGLMVLSQDGKYLIIQNATPAVSVTIVDTEEKKFVSEIPTPGCWAILPSLTDSRRFSTICGDGTLLTIGFDGDGKPVSQIKSKQFFDADKDPSYIVAPNDGSDYYFTTYFGQVTKVNLNDSEPKIGETWNLLSAKDKKGGWRPGGYQLTAIDAVNGKFYVGVHPKGYDGSHKNPAQEVWEYDLSSHKRLRRLPGKSALALAISHSGDKPSLYLLSAADASLLHYSLDKKSKLLAKSEPGIVEMVSSFRLK